MLSDAYEPHQPARRDQVLSRDRGRREREREGRREGGNPVPVRHLEEVHQD